MILFNEMLDAIIKNDGYVSSARNREKLISILQEIKRKNTYLDYIHKVMSITSLEDLGIFELGAFFEQLYIQHCHKGLRFAVKNWDKMSAMDRIGVISEFKMLFYDQILDFSASQQALFFCEIFLAEFVEPLILQEHATMN